MTQETNWLLEIEFSNNKAIESAKLKAEKEGGVDPYTCYMEAAEQDAHLLLKAYKELRKAIEEAPHEETCVWWYSGNDENPYRCTCWKDSALNYNPTEVM
jgi:hypothetical protein